MKAYINKTNKALSVYSNFTPSDTTDLIELTEAQYKELQEKKKDNYIPSFSIENDKVVITYIKNNEDIKEPLRKELQAIKAWFTANDWKVNKVVIGEWETTDQRWLDYLAEREIKRARQDELVELLK